MATQTTSGGNVRDDGILSASGSKRRKQERSKNSGHERKGKKKRGERDKESKNDRLKVQSVSELAELVTSGAIQIPKSLTFYLKDRAQLLDQVFTILSPEDVKGKLPDILKGLKLKQVRHLCFQQLKNMMDDDIIKAISTPDPAPPHSATPPRPKSTQTRLSHVTSQQPSASLTPPHQAAPTETQHGGTIFSLEANKSTVASSSNDKVKAGRKRKSSEMKPAEEEEVKDTKKKVDMEQVHKSVLEEAVQMVLDVSDISEETSLSPRDEDPVAPEASGSKELDRGKLVEEKTVEEHLGYCNAESATPDSPLIEKEQCHGEVEASVGGRSEETTTGRDRGGQLELTTKVCQSSSTPPDALELLEMKLRRKALESELRRRSVESEKQKELEEEKTQVRMTEDLLKQRMHKEKEKDFPDNHQRHHEDYVSTGRSFRTEKRDELEEDGGHGDSLEERLRRRALQSMWARRKSKECS